MDVVEALAVLAKPHRTGEVVHALDVVYVAPHRDKRDVLAGELHRLAKPILAVGELHADLVRLDLAGLDHLNAELRQFLGRQGRLIGKGLDAVGQAPQLTLDRLLVPILADNDLAALGEVGVFLVIEEGGQVSIRPAALMLFLAHQVFKEQESAVAAVNLRRGRVELHGKRVADGLNPNV